MDQERKSLGYVITMLSAGIGLIVVLQWCMVIGFTVSDFLQDLIFKIGKKNLALRFVYVILIVFSAYLFPLKKKKATEDWKWNYVLLTLACAVLITIGYSKNFFYNLFIFPIVFVSYFFVTAKAVSAFVSNSVNPDKDIFGLSQKKSEFFFVLETIKGPVYIHKPQQNIYIDGGPGSGKSESWIKGMIYQCAERNYAGLIYDWEGDPSQANSPILSKIAYGSIEYFKRKGTCTIGFAFINFTDMMRTKRVNVFSEKYVPKNNAALFIRNIAITLMKNLEPSWKEKTDFWAKNAMNFVFSVAYKCYKEGEKGINTLPHVITFCLSDYNAVFSWLEEDHEITLNMSSMFSAWKLEGAGGQLAGTVASAQTPLVMLNNKYIFWVMSPAEDEEFSLDITNKNNPTLLCIGNAPNIKEAISPPISCIASVVMSMMNMPGKQSSVFMVDEFPTVNLQGIDTFIGTARKHNVSTILAVQDFNQAVRDYGEKSANILKAACGNQAFGMTGNDKTARDVEALFGENKEIHESFSQQDSGGGSRTESLQKEKVLKARDVAGQVAGHFIGKIANGEPPFFNTQFNICKYEEMEIPEFSKLVQTGDLEMDREIMEKMVEKNYERILSEVKQILSNYKKAE